MTLIINGQEQRVSDGQSLAGLLRTLDLDPQRVAVELNQEAIKRENFAARQLRDGDRIELVQFVGGG